MRIAIFVLCGALAAGCAGVSGTPPVSTSAASAASSAFSAASAGKAGAGQYLELYSFGGEQDGGSPQAGLVAVKGELYGTTSAYGNGYGTVFKVNAFGNVTTLYRFGGSSDGAYPQAGLIWFNKTLYGTTSAGGLYGGGTVFSVKTDGEERVLHNFGKGTDGAQVEAPLIEHGGYLFGTTQNGGTHRLGVVFEMTTDGQETVLHQFVGSPRDAAHPTSPLLYVKGNFFGLTRAGGKNAGGGTVFEMSPFGATKVLHSFKVEPGDGSNPDGSLIYENGIFYGTTLHGGNIGRGYGTVFEITAHGDENVLHDFGARNDGAFPDSGLVLWRGKFYGTTTGGGSSPRQPNDCISSGLGVKPDGYYKCGTIFSVTPFGQEKVLYRFGGDPDGANPEAGLTLAGGALYGTTDWGGNAGYFGSIFRLVP